MNKIYFETAQEALQEGYEAIEQMRKAVEEQGLLPIQKRNKKMEARIYKRKEQKWKKYLKMQMDVSID